jgi:NAD(P)-dependent dehydrogenase (short-subunit alcohol dehydrogenase family)
MEQFEGRVAVVTGAASGIGLGMARRFAREKLRVVLADIEAPALEEARAELEKAGAEVLAVRTDVSSADAVQELAQRAHEAFGKVHILCNNAGVAGGAGGAGGIWQTNDKDWQWVLGVNLMGVVHGLQAFVPRMLEHGEEGHIVNTSSILGVTSGNGSIYSVTKHAVTRLTEGLSMDLRMRKAQIGVSVLCPGLIATRIVTSGRNRPEHLRNEVQGIPADAIRERMEMAQQRFMEAGMPADQVGDMVFDAIREGRFYIFTHPDLKKGVKNRMDDILNDRAPRIPRSLMGGSQ